MHEITPIAAVSSNTANSTIRQQLRALGPHYLRCQIRIAQLLLQCQCERLWQQDYNTFEEYLDKEVRIGLRTAQELMRVWRNCQQFEISESTIESLGWAKIAIVSRRMNKENRDELLMDVAHLSAAELRKKYCKQKSEKESTEETLEGQDPEVPSKPELLLIGVIADALRVAAARTRSHDIQSNMEFIAQRFLQTTDFPMVFSRTGENN